ncbi:hypothetical protein Tco_0865235 [Tanacetum coccineum]
MSEFGDSSFHNNSGRRMMTLEQEELYPWEQLKSSDVDICFLIISKFSIYDLRLDLQEENVHALRMEMREIHASINNDLKGEKESKAKKLMIEKSMQLWKQIAIEHMGVEKLTNDRPPMLEKGNYIPWESRFRRFLDNMLKDGERMWPSIEKGPYERPLITDPDDDKV